MSNVSQRLLSCIITALLVLNGWGLGGNAEYFQAHAEVVTANKLMSTGLNSFGQLGDGTTIDRLVPVEAVDLADAVDIAAGDQRTLALKPDGSVWTWGKQETSRFAGAYLDPRRVITDGAVAIASGDYHDLVLKSDGTVWSWGYNGFGQLGYGAPGRFSYGVYPTKVLNLTDVVAVAGGGIQSLALKADGTVWAWGGVLGNGTNNISVTPVQVHNLTDVVAIAAGSEHSLALKADGTVWAWGNNNYGQVGNGASGGYVTTPQQVVEITNAVQVNAGGYHSIVLLADGTVRTWGSNMFSQLGDGTGDSSATPVAVVNLTNVKSIAGGFIHNLALKNDGTVWVWGDNCCGQFGDGTSLNNSQIPLQVPDISNVVIVAAGNASSMFFSQFVLQGQVMATGLNYYGQLGDGTKIDRLFPVATLNLGDVVDVAAGDQHSLALKPDGSVWTWGIKTTSRFGSVDLKPRRVFTDGVVAIESGEYHDLVLKSDGTVWSWGYNGFGQLGYGAPGRFSYGVYPTKILNLTNVVAVAGGGIHSLALKADGTVWAWGSLVGNGTLNNSVTPVQVLNLTDVVAIAAGSEHSLALKADGTVWGWGNNNYGQVGNGATGGYVTIPQQVVGITNAVQVKAGGYHSIVLLADGTVRTWGSNMFSQLGDGTGNSSATPVSVVNLTNVESIAGGFIHNLALKNDGTVWVWGDNCCGQFGDGTSMNNSQVPLQIPSLSNVFIVAAGNASSMFLRK
ncbi:MAG: RCC1 repeat-containing protein [Desulfobulbaceae bacterium]|nr:RCC1 repeat-containing protein [Desulfobulbaceae bacterium]